MSAEPTSSLTFNDLILEVALKAGFAYYGASGDEQPQIPVDTHDLFECKRHANNAIRMFVNDAPKAGWRWARPVAEVKLWATVLEDDAVLMTAETYIAEDDQTTITLTAAGDVFKETMEDATIVFESSGSFTIKNYVAADEIIVRGDASAVFEEKFSIEADGDYRLPRHFAGAHGGPITFARDTNQTTRIDWTDEVDIRRLRNISSDTIGFPIIAAIRLAKEVQTGDRRRYVFSVFPAPYTDFDVEFKFHLGFTELVGLTEFPPSPMVHDETLRAAVRAVIERDVDRITDGPDWQYYRGICLKRSHEYDARSGPRRLGYFGNNPRDEREKDGRGSEGWRRPNVTFNG